MMSSELKLNWKKWLAVGGAVIVVGGGLAYGARAVVQLVILNRTLQTELASEQQTLAYQRNYYENQLGLAAQNNSSLQQNLQNQKSRNDAIEQQVSQITGTVGTLQKVAATDPQLLQKYSRVYFLNENYVPASLTNIDPAYLFNKGAAGAGGAGVAEQFLSPALPFLVNMLIAARQASTSLQIASAYRSFAQQSQLKSAYTVSYGSGANKFSADQGYSEHQLGTAVDFITPGLGALNLKFASTSAYAWLTANAYRYGFELSYPPRNPYYIYEPWHWRFIGVALATWLHNSSTTFYDAPQRTINTYLVSLFDQ